jgi:hypothetical protein
MDPHAPLEPAAVGPTNEGQEEAVGDAGSSLVDRHVPRKRLLAGVPIAIGAIFLGGRRNAKYAGTDGDWRLDGNAPGSRKFLGTTNAQPLTIKTNNHQRMVVTSGGSVGIGTNPSGARLHVATAAVAGTGIKGTSPNSISTALSAMGVQGVGTVGVQGTGEYMGVQGTSLNYGVFGFTNPDTGGIGVYGRGGQGVKGRSYTGFAVLGDTDSGTGVKGEAYSDGGAVKGVHGQAFGANSNGVVGEASNGTAAYGIWGISSAGYAGVFSGKVLVSGTLSKGGGSFKIDHPLDPANKYLYHSFVESPDMMNVYNGNVKTDASGSAVVELPGYFDALNRDFRYQLTVIDQFAQAIVAKKIAGNRFTIKTDKPNVEVSWQVTGIRQDAFANANRIPVEEDKPAAERGLFLHAKEHGKPTSLGVQHARLKAARGNPAKRAADPVAPA